MAQQTFSGVPGAFAAGAVLTAAEQELIRDFMVALIKEGMTGDTGEILPMIMDLTNNRIVLDSGGLEFSDATTQTTAATAGISWSGSTANGLGTYASSSSIVSESTATYDGTTLALTTSGGGLKLDGLNSSDANTLDDYEFGLWTANILCDSGSITVNTSLDTGAYVKIGKLVHIQGQFGVSAISSPSGTLKMSGLPFAAASLSEESDIAVNLGTVNQLTTTVAGLWTKIGQGQSYFDFRAGGKGQSTVDDTTIADLVDTGTAFYVGGSYRTA